MRMKSRRASIERALNAAQVPFTKVVMERTGAIRVELKDDLKTFWYDCADGKGATHMNAETRYRVAVGKAVEAALIPFEIVNQDYHFGGTLGTKNTFIVRFLDEIDEPPDTNDAEQKALDEFERERQAIPAPDDGPVVNDALDECHACGRTHAHDQLTLIGQHLYCDGCLPSVDDDPSQLDDPPESKTIGGYTMPGVETTELPFNTVLKSGDCKPGQERFAHCKFFGNPHVQYDYRSAQGELYSCLAPTLEIARSMRDRWWFSNHPKDNPVQTANYEAQPGTNTLTVSSIAQKILFVGELQGQLSDGFWENAKPFRHHEPWCALKWDDIILDGNHVGVTGPELKQARRRNYNFANKELLEYVGARMQFMVALCIMEPKAIDYLKDNYLPEGPEFKPYTPQRNVKMVETFGVNWPEAFAYVWEGRANVYTMAQLRKDLKALSAALKTNRK